MAKSSTVVALPMMPLPVSVALAEISRSPLPVAEPVKLLARSVPELTVVPPVNELAPVNVKVPVPALVSEVTPLSSMMVPAKVASVLSDPIIQFAVESCEPGAPESSPMLTVPPDT